MTEQTQEATETQETTDQTEKFDAAYVEKLREENAKHRKEAQAAKTKATKAQNRANQVVLAKELAGVLSDPNDLLVYVPEADIYDESGDVDPEKVKPVVDGLLESRPYLANRVFGGDVGMGDRGPATPEQWSFSDYLRANAR